MTRGPVLPALALALAVALGACSAAADDDGEAYPAGPPGAVVTEPDARRVVVDTDLAGDDLAALGFLLRRPDVRVEAVTIAGTGLVRCEAGADIVADLITALRTRPMPIACGREDAGPHGRTWPADWRALAEAGSGLLRTSTTRSPVREPAADLIARLATPVDGRELTVVALGPLTNLADAAAARPAQYRRLRIWSMAGAIDSPAVDGVAEWNAAADPDAAVAVLAGDAPVTLVPDDAVPAGEPAGLAAAPVLGQVAATMTYLRWWDTATVTAFVVPDAAEVETGRWTVDRTGRLSRRGDGPVRVVRTLDADALAAAQAETFG